MNKFQVIQRLGILIVIISMFSAAFADDSIFNIFVYLIVIGLIMIVVGWIFK
jgi:hypothetical protein